MKDLMKKLSLMTALILVSAGFLSQQAHAQGPITGNITFAGSVTLDTNSVNTATEVVSGGWHGPVSSQNPSGLPQVQSADGTFASQGVMTGDPTTFASPWTFNSGSVPAFWSVDGFTFDLSASHIVQQTGNGFLTVTGTGTVSHMGFLPSAGTFSFSSQDPSANSRFSFSAASSVPEPGTTGLISAGGICLAGVVLRRKLRVKAS